MIFALLDYNVLSCSSSSLLLYLMFILQVTPRPLERNLRLVCASSAALTRILDMEPGIATREEFAEFIAGRKLPYGALPVAHRFGSLTSLTLNLILSFFITTETKLYVFRYSFAMVLLISDTEDISTGCG